MRSRRWLFRWSRPNPREENVDFSVAASIVLKLLPFLEELDLPKATILNINIPDLPVKDINGVKFTTLGRRLKSDNPVRAENPRGKTVYWIGKAGGPVQDSPSTDFHEVENGCISITPIYADMTHTDVLRYLASISTTDIAGDIAGKKTE